MTWESELIATEAALARARVELSEWESFQAELDAELTLEGGTKLGDKPAVWDARRAVLVCEGFAEWLREQITSNAPYSLEASMKAHAAIQERVIEEVRNA